MILGSKFHTESITEAITINAADSVMQVSISVVTGTCTYQGDFPFQGRDSDAITLEEGDTITISGTPPSGPIDGLTITPIGGNTNILMNF